MKTYIYEQATDVPFVGDSEYLLEEEQQILSTPALRDLRQTPSLTLSKLKALDGGDGEEVQCKVGQVVRVRADLVDGFGRRRKLGYDDVRAWIVEKKRDKGSSRRAGVEVTDLKNGSYVASFRCLWAGSSYIHVNVAYPREYLALVLRSRRARISRYIFGVFINKDKTEVTPCFSTPNLPWPCLCNLTAWNDASFFCGRPRDPQLTCKDLQRMGVIPTRDETIGMSPLEVRLINTMSRQAVQAVIQTNMTLKVSEGKTLPSINSSCRQAGSAITWTASSPKGYFDEGVWQTLLCRPRSLTPERLKACLTNTTVWFLGDSNTQALIDNFKTLLDYNRMNSKCSVETNLWYATRTCSLSGINAKFHYMRHENTFYFSKQIDSLPAKREKSLVELIDSLPSTGRIVVVVHYFMHVVVAHLSVARDRLQRLHGAMSRLARRNPDAVLALRGPHITQKEWEVNHLQGGDTQGMLYLKMIKDLFRDMQEKVIFLDGWDMSIAIENDLFHPPAQIPMGMVKLLLDFACD